MPREHEHAELIQLIEGQAEDIATMLAEVAAIPASGPTAEGYPEIVALLAQELSDAGLDVETIDVPTEYLTRHWGRDLEKTLEYIPVRRFVGRKIVFGRRKGAKPGAPSLHLTQHYDLPGRLAALHTGAVEVRDGRMYAPGVSFCRSGIVAMLAAARAVKQARVDLAGDLFMSFTPDNHLGGDTGAGYLAEQGYGRSGLVITAGEGGPDTIVLGERGILWLKITTHGISTSGFVPHLGINAIDKMATVQRALAGLEPMFAKRPTQWPIIPVGTSSTSLVCSQIRSSGWGVPDTCVLFVDRRVLPEETVSDALDEIVETIRSLQAQDSDLVVDTEAVHAVEPVITAADAPLVTALGKNVREVLGVEPRMAVHGEYAEHHRFPQHWGAQTIGFSPGRKERAAGEAEYVLISDVTLASKVLALTVRDLLAN